MIWRGRPSDIRSYLDNRKARGFNTPQVMVLPAGTGPAGVNAPDINGNRPFTDGKVLDIASVNERT